MLSTYLKEEHGFSNPEFLIKEFERGNQEFVFPDVESFVDERAKICSVDLWKIAQTPLHSNGSL